MSTNAREDGDPPVWLITPQLQDLVLTVLADNMRGRLDTVWSGGVVQILEGLGFTAGASRVALARLTKRNLVVPVRSGRLVSYELTERTAAVLADGDRRIFSLDAYDFDEDEVTLLIHGIPDSMRRELSQLGRRLRFLGFGSVQDGMWIGAGHRYDEVLPIVDRLRIGSYSSIIEGTLRGRPELRAVIDDAWDFPRLNDLYRDFVEAFRPLVASRPDTDVAAFHLRTQVMHNYRQFTSLDPGIRSARHPSPPAKAEAIEIFTRIYSSYADAAHRHFDLMVRMPGA